MTTAHTPTALAEAMKAVDGIFALEGMVPDAATIEMDRRLLAGEITLGQAREYFVAQARPSSDQDPLDLVETGLICVQVNAAIDTRHSDGPLSATLN